MAVEFLSAEQEARYGRFVADPTPEELERFFRLDEGALELVRSKRRASNRVGWTVQWGTVRMLGTLLTDDGVKVPSSVVVFAAGQIGEDPEAFAGYGNRRQTVYEHAWEIRDGFGYRDFAAGQEEVGPEYERNVPRRRFLGWWGLG